MKVLKRIISAALKAADPADAVRRSIERELGLLRVNGQEYAMRNFSAINLISVGKAAIPMAEATSSILGKDLSGGIVLTKHLTENTLPERLMLLDASHPLPDERSFSAGKRILAFLEKTESNDLVLFLISGGGSALMTAPFTNVSLADMEELTSLLLGCGARIDEINILRRALDRVKGGGLARAAYPAQIITLLLSDVVNSPLEAIASGPTVPNPTSRKDAFAVLEKYNLLSEAPAGILTFLKDDTPLDSYLPLPEGNNFIIGSNVISAQAAKKEAEENGFYAEVLTTSLQGEAANVGRDLGIMLREKNFRQYGIHNIYSPFCLILGGETTVTLGDKVGYGGRNQELALGAVKELTGAKRIALVTFATDGEDGPTDAAGAIVTGESFARAKAMSLDVHAHLREHTSYHFFDALGDLLKIGSTGTNVNDLTFLFGF